MTALLTLLYHDVYVTDPAESGFAGEGAGRYKLPLTEFERQLACLAEVLHAPPLRVTQPEAAANPLPLALTFDDGGRSYFTQVAERLEARGWRGHCFVTSDWIGRPGFLDRQQLRELHARGHVIGSHSASHPVRFAACTPERMRREWRDSRAALQDILGADVTVASVPGGYFAPRAAQAAAEAGITTLFTSEPETRARRIAGCTVRGRYTLRRGDPTDLAARLAAREPGALYPAWLKWNVKKPVKALLGAGYPLLAERFARLERQQGERIQ